MTFSWGFKDTFAIEYERFSQEQQLKIAQFIKTYEECGLSDFSVYEGKIAPSWSGLQHTNGTFQYARDNHLWHYHVGLPSYRETHGKYKTSDMLLHFQWIDRGSYIDLVDIYDHYRCDGSFYLPPADYLK